MLTLDKFEEASEKVKEVTLETKLVYSDYWSQQTGNKVYLFINGNICIFLVQRYTFLIQIFQALTVL